MAISEIRSIDAENSPLEPQRGEVPCDDGGAQEEITISPPALAGGSVGAAYSQSIILSGGVSPLKLSLAGALPPGVTFNFETGEFSGTPKTAGSFNFIVRVQDANGSTGSREYALTIDTTFIEQRSTEQIRNFMAHRADILTTQEPNLSSGFSRLGASATSGNEGQNFQAVGAGGAAPFNLGLSATKDGAPTSLMFATSVQQILNAARNAAEADRNRMVLGAADYSFPTQAANPVFDLWVQAQATRFDDKGSDSDGNVGLVYVGADYLLRPGMLIGAIVQFDRSKEQSSAIGSEITGHGWMAGPYFAARVTPQIYVDARAAWGQSDNSSSPIGTYTDDFATQRWLLRARVTGNLGTGPWRFAPGVTVAHFEEKLDSYVDSNGILIPGQTEALGRLTFGSEIAYRFQASDGTAIEPVVAVQGIWDFNSGSDPTVNGIVAANNDLRARLEAGLTFIARNGSSLRASGAADGLGDREFAAYSGQLWINMPLN